MTDRILTTRMEAHPSDSHTLERYSATGGYDALRTALKDRTPEQLVEEVGAEPDSPPASSGASWPPLSPGTS